MSKKNCQQIPTLEMIPNSKGMYKETYKCTSSGGTNYIDTKMKHVFTDEPLYETHMPLTPQAMLLNSSLGGGMDMMPFGTVMPDIGGMGGMGMLPLMMGGNKNGSISDLMTMSLLLGRGNNRTSSQQQTTSAPMPTVNMIPPQENFEVKMLPDIN